MPDKRESRDVLDAFPGIAPVDEENAFLQSPNKLKTKGSSAISGGCSYCLLPQQLAILSPATCAEEHTGVCEQYCSIWPENTQGSSVSELKKFGQNARSFYVRIAIQGKREKSRHSENRPAPQRRSQRVFALDHLGRPPDSPCRRMLQQQAR